VTVVPPFRQFTWVKDVQPIYEQDGCTSARVRRREGKNVFKLSLRVHDASFDLPRCSERLSGLAINRVEPDQSLII